MDISTVLQLVKDRQGIKTNIRDNLLTAIINGVITELQDEKGLVIDVTNPYQLIFVVDYATWRYKNPDGDMPRHLKFRLHNLMIHVGAANLRVDSVETVAELPSSPAEFTVYILNTDGSKQMCINNAWTTVNFINSSWVVV